MPTNGFRLFATTLHDGRMQEPHPFGRAQARNGEDGETPPPADYRDVLAEVLNAETEPWERIVVSRRSADADGLADEGSAPGSSRGFTGRLRGAVRVGAAARIAFEAGPITTDGVSADPDGLTEDFPLEGRSTVLPYRATLVARDDLRVGLLAVEARGQSCPAEPLRRALGAIVTPWRLRIHQNVADSAAVRDFIRQGEVERVDLFEYYLDPDSQRRRRRVSLGYSIREERERQSIAERLLGWVDAGSRASDSVARDNAREMRDEFFASDVDLSFDEPAVIVSRGRLQRTFKPSSDFGRFTYDLGDNLVGADEFYQAAERVSTELLDGVQTLTAGE